MEYKMDKSTTKLLLATVLIVAAYLAFFGFNAQAAYTYTVNQMKSIF